MAFLSLEKGSIVSADRSKLELKRSSIVIFTAVTLVLCGLYLHLSWNRYEDIVSSEAVMLAESLESLLHPEHIVELSGTDQDLDKPEYITIKHTLMRLLENENPVRFAYLMAERDGKIIFLLDSEPPDSPDYSPPGQIYEEADDLSWEPFKSGKTVLTAASTDRWGTWISVLVPVKDQASENVIAVFGIDYSAQDWNLRLWRRMVPDFIIVLFFLLIVFALLRVLNQRSFLKKLSEKLALEEALYHSIFDQAPIGIAVLRDKSFVFHPELENMNINPKFEQILARKSSDFENIKWTDITYPDDLQADLDQFVKFQRGEIKGYSIEKRFLKPDGSSVWTNMRISPLSGIPHMNDMHLCLIEDISAHKQVELTLKESERSKSVLLSHLPGMAYRCKNDREWTMQYVSDGCLNLTGYQAESLLSNKDISYNEIITPKYHEPLRKEWEVVLAQKRLFRYEYEIETADGNHKWVLEMGQGIYNEHGEVEALEGIVLDISDKKKVEDQLKYFSEHDVWTGLYNRRRLYDVFRADQESGNARNAALVGVSLSSIHLLSLRYGFQYTQELIKSAAAALHQQCSDNYQLFYTYENRFTFYVRSYNDKKELLTFCETIATSLEFILSAERIGASISVMEIGVSKNLDIEQLLKNILVASDKGLDTTGSDIGISFFNDEIHKQILREEKISRELIQIAAGNNVERLFMQYQPILDLKSKRIAGFEALVRLNSKTMGLIAPAEFITIAEKTKLIIPLGNLIILQVLNFLNRLKEEGYNSTSIAINISVIQLLRDDFIKNLLQMTNEKHINTNSVILEITESVFASSFIEVNKILAKLKELGFLIAIDDFGTEYSSLSRERELNINCIKIDKYFVDKLLEVDPERSITSDIISMGHKLGHFVIAEGVETEMQLQYLKDHGCDKVQGYLIGKPLDEDAALALIRQIAYTNTDGLR
jgi:PAS domain S-box-containing protein